MGRAGRLKAQVGAPESEPDESMNSRVSWSVEGIDPSVRERAEAAARRAGMSLNDWLNSTLGETARPDFQSPYDQPAAMPGRETPDVSDIHQRLDSITRQIEQISQPRARGAVPRSEMHRTAAPHYDTPRSDAARGEPGVARQLNDAISRLDARLSQISNPAPRQAQMQDRQRQAEMVERAASQVYRPSPPLSPASFDFALAVRGDLILVLRLRDDALQFRRDLSADRRNLGMDVGHHGVA